LRSLLLAFAAVALTAGPAAAQVPPAPPAPPVEPRIAQGVTIAQIDVAGMTADEASSAVAAAFERPLRFAFRARRWNVRPATLGARAAVTRAVSAALVALSGEDVPLGVRVDGAAVRRYVTHLDRVFSRRPRDSQLRLRNLRPFLTRARTGVDVRTLAMRIAIVGALRRMERTTMRLQVRLIRPTVTRVNFGPIVVIHRGSRRLYLYRNTTFVRRFRIAVGMPRYPTPLGRYRVISKERNPTWDPPSSPWAAGLGPVPPGPGNPLGTRWIGTSAPAIGIHGTPQPWTVGTAASHGCIRMYMREVEWLFERVRIGTPVLIVRA
jgi:hypothetical protein